MELYQTAKGPPGRVGGGTQGKEITKIHQQLKKGVGDDSFFFSWENPWDMVHFFGSSLHSFDFLVRKSGPGHMS